MVNFTHDDIVNLLYKLWSYIFLNPMGFKRKCHHFFRNVKGGHRISRSDSFADFRFCVLILLI